MSQLMSCLCFVLNPQPIPLKIGRGRCILFLVLLGCFPISSLHLPFSGSVSYSSLQ
ncbi:hypothetical protein BHM03_00005763 [Ensete ventricosum]|nr:hypothetical protein BHM03_00005763 [Ensete ventricosum]